MTTRFQTWLLSNTKGLQYLVNERLANRAGGIGSLFKALRIGEREYGHHTLFRAMKVTNYYWVMMYQMVAMTRQNLTRFIGVQNGPLNYSGLFVWWIATSVIIARFRFIRHRDVLSFHQQDQPEFWFSRYNMMFPPNFLHNRLSAHYIEINHIFAVEMFKKYHLARREIIAERDACTQEERATKYAINPNYVWEPLGPDDDKIQRMKDDNLF